MSGNENLAKNMAQLRKQKDLLQEKLARLEDVANNTIMEMESGENKNLTPETFRKVIRSLDVSFGVSVDVLLN